MLIAIGYFIILGSVFGGYWIVGGYLGALYQPAEFLIILGAGVGAFVASNNGKGIGATIRTLPMLMRGPKYRKNVALDLMTLLYLLLVKVRQSGMMSIERDIETPEESAIFSRYPSLLGDHMIMQFISDYLRLMISGNMDSFEIEALMDHEIETFQQEAEMPAQGLATMADSLPAFGIVAAVMGVVHALGEAGSHPGAVGSMVAQAMVGTFLGILLAYGFISPLAARVRGRVEENVKILQSVKVTLIAHLNSYPPPLAVEFGRKALFSEERPSFSELEEHVRDARSPSSTAEAASS